MFQKLSLEGQSPHALFITCSDSRVIAELITQSKPGELFVVKNVGNIVPPASVAGSANSTAAAVEFAVQTLGVTDIVVCGHSQCGAMTALLGDARELQETSPHLKRWLELAAPVAMALREKHPHLSDRQARVTAAAKENVLLGLENLRTYECVRERAARGNVRLHGWFFQIATAELFAWDVATRQFAPLLAPGTS